MDHSDQHHDADEWQQIEKPPRLGSWDMVVVNENYLQVHVDQSSSTEDPPTPTTHQHHHFHHHEGSPETVVPNTATMDPENRTSSSPSAEGEAEMTVEAHTPPPSDWRVRVANEGRNLLKLRLEAARNGVVRAACKVRDYAVCAGAFWSVTSVAGAAAAAAVLVAVVYVGIRLRRRSVGCRQSVEVEHLMYLLREKDEKISQLILHIAQLNEVLSSRRKVPVLRINGS